MITSKLFRDVKYYKIRSSLDKAFERSTHNEPLYHDQQVSIHGRPILCREINLLYFLPLPKQTFVTFDNFMNDFVTSLPISTGSALDLSLFGASATESMV